MRLRAEVALLERHIGRISDERDRLRRRVPPGSEAVTAVLPRPALLDETTEIPVITPDGRALLTRVSPGRRRPSWARDG